VSEKNTEYTRTYVLEIQNGTSVQGLARNTALLFQAVGYSVYRTTNASSQDVDKTVIIDHIGNPDIAKNLGSFIRCTNIQEEEVKKTTPGSEGDLQEQAMVDFTIILGRDFDGRYVRGAKQ
jgi:hypothetical protein